MENIETREIEKEISISLQNKKEQHSNWKVFLNLYRYLLREKSCFYWGLFFSFLNSVFYIIGSGLIGLVVKVFFEPVIESQAKFDLTNFSITIILLALAFILYGIFRYLESYLYTKVAFRSGANLRNEIIEKLHKMPMSFYDKRKTGDLISRLIVDVNNVANSIFQMLTQVGTAFFSIVISIVMLFLVSTKLSLIVIPLSLVLFGLVALLTKKSQPYFIKIQRAFGDLNSFVEEMLTNTKVTNAFDRQKDIYKELQTITKNIRNSAYVGDVIAKSFDTWYSIISNLIVVAIAFISALFFTYKINVWGLSVFGSKNGIPTPSLILMYISLCWSYIGPFQSLLGSTFSLQVGIAASSRLFEILEIPNPDKSQETITLKQNQIKGLIEFENVYFKYAPNLKEYQLKNASFKALPGQTVAIVGPTGAGKTTIISILSKYYDYNLGSIKLDGYELKNIQTESIRDNMTVVLQDSFLFNETIMDNLKLARPSASDEEIIEAAKLTKAHHFIMSMQNGYNTMIENNGANISQGQKQLLALTRAILQNKSILILDEATSNIDSSTEKVVQKAMLRLMEGKTSFVIAHRLSTIKNADLIIVVDNGFIIQKGTHEELLAQKGFYYELYQAQFSENRN